MQQLIIETIVVGLATMLFGTIASFIVSPLFKIDLPPVCKSWNKNYVMEISLFLTGVLAHLVFELTGLNKWYCKKGYACLR